MRDLCKQKRKNAVSIIIFGVQLKRERQPI